MSSYFHSLINFFAIFFRTRYIISVSMTNYSKLYENLLLKFGQYKPLVISMTYSILSVKRLGKLCSNSVTITENFSRLFFYCFFLPTRSTSRKKQITSDLQKTLNGIISISQEVFFSTKMKKILYKRLCVNVSKIE